MVASDKGRLGPLYLGSDAELVLLPVGGERASSPVQSLSLSVMRWLRLAILLLLLPATLTPQASSPPACNSIPRVKRSRSAACRCNLVVAPGGGKRGHRAQRLARAGAADRRSEDAQGHADVEQDGAFYGAAFSPDGRSSTSPAGTTTRSSATRGRTARPRSSGRSRSAKAEDGGQDRVALSGRRGGVGATGSIVYVAENVGDALAVVELGDRRDRAALCHRSLSVRHRGRARGGDVYVSAWGATTRVEFRVLARTARSSTGGAHRSRTSSVGAAAIHGHAPLRRRSPGAIASRSSIRIARKVVRLRCTTRAGRSARGEHAECAGASRRRQTCFYVAEGGQQRRRRLRRRERRHARPHPGRLVSDSGRPRRQRTADRLNGKGHGTHANPDGPTPRHGMPSDKPRATRSGRSTAACAFVPAEMTASQLADTRAACRGREQLERARRGRGAIRRSSTSSTSSKRTAPTIRSSAICKEGDGDPAWSSFRRDRLRRTITRSPSASASSTASSPMPRSARRGTSGRRRRT